VSKQNVVCYVFIITLFPSSAFGSSAVAVVTPQGIVVGVDEKSVVRCSGPCGILTGSKKIVVLQDHVVLGTAGLYTVLGNHFVAPYHFPSLVDQVKTRLTGDQGVSRVSEIVKEEAGKVFLWFDLYLRGGLIKQEDIPGDYPAEYLIAGYEAGAPAVYSVYVEVDWAQLRLKGIQRVLMHPKPNAKRQAAVYGVGSQRVLQQLLHQRGDLYRKLLSNAASESRRLLDHKQLSLQQAGRLVRAMLETEADSNPAHVGPPFTIVTIPKDGTPR
jgi:hypothetical protein